MKRFLHRIMKIGMWLLICGWWTMPLLAANATLPDSLITEDKVYEYTFSDTPLAERIMEKLRGGGGEASYL